MINMDCMDYMRTLPDKAFQLAIVDPPYGLDRKSTQGADTLVAVRRKDVDLDSKEGRDMALLDNLTTQIRAPFTQGGGLRRGSSTSEAAKPSGGVKMAA